MSTADSEPVAKLDLSLYRSDNFNHQITWQDADGNPIDLTSYTAKMQARKTVSTTTVLMTATDTDGLVLGGAAGTIDIQLTPAQTNISNQDNVYDLELTSPAGFITTVVQGLFIVKQDVTR